MLRDDFRCFYFRFFSHVLSSIPRSVRSICSMHHIRHLLFEENCFFHVVVVAAVVVVVVVRNKFWRNEIIYLYLYLYLRWYLRTIHPASLCGSTHTDATFGHIFWCFARKCNSFASIRSINTITHFSVETSTTSFVPPRRVGGEQIEERKKTDDEMENIGIVV